MLAYTGRMATRPITIKIRVTEAGCEAIDKMAEQEERTRSDMCRMLIAEAVKARTKR